MIYKVIYELQKIGPLDCISIESGSDTCVVFLHGYGADAYDLAPLANELKLKKAVDFYFPNGPLEIDLGGMTGRAWFHIDTQALQKAVERGVPRDYATNRPSGVDKAEKLVHGFLGVLCSRYKNIILGGFSQGAMLATDMTMKQLINPQALIFSRGL